MATSDDELAQTATAPPGAGSRPRGTDAAPLGDTLGRYRLERMLGEGGMGVVHAAFDPDLERRVALKVLRTLDGGGEARQRLLREARAMARLTHANVVTVHEVGTAGDRDYVAMELIDGQTLAEWLEGKPRAVADIVAAFVAAGRGLSAAHAAGLVHRDFKPHNVLRRRDGRIVVTDFGLARGVENSPGIALEQTANMSVGQGSQPSSLSGLTATGSVLGTPAYMAPEQWSGGNIGPAADQFAFCVALWEAITGERPFRGDSIEALKAQVSRGPGELDASKLPRRLRRPLRRGLDPDPNKRWPDMDALLSSLVRAERRPGLAFGIVGGALVVGGVAMVAMRGGGSSCEPPAVPPNHVWSSMLAIATPPELAHMFDAQVTKWTLARATACTAEPTERKEQLRCLDGVLARFDVVRQSYGTLPGLHDEDALMQLADPSSCLTPTPPKSGLPVTPDVIAAFVLHAKLKSTVVFPTLMKDAQAFVERPGLDACARAMGQYAVEQISQEFPVKKAAINDAVQSSEQCDDDRMRAELLLVAARYALELPMIGPKGEAAIKRADAVIKRAGEPHLAAGLDFMRGFVDAQHERWDEGFALGEGAVDTLDKAGMPRHALQLLIEVLAMHMQRGLPKDLDRIRALARRWLPIARELKLDDNAHELEREDAMARYAAGDVVGAHADLVRLWHPSPPNKRDPGVHVEGDVLDREGKPVAGATIAVARLVVADSIGVGLPLYHFHEGDHHLRIATTDERGHFAVLDAPADGIIIAQLGDRRSTPAPVGEHVKLVVVPTRRIAGKIALGTHAHTEIVIHVEESDVKLQHYELVAPVKPDGTFAVDGAPIDNVQVEVAVDSYSGGTNVQYTQVPASSEAVTGLSLAIPSTGRALDVIARSTLQIPLDTAEIFVFPGKHPATKLGEIVETNFPGLVAMFAHHVSGEKAPKSVLDQLHAADLVMHFPSVPAGDITVCVLGFNGDLMDEEVQRKINKHEKELDISCSVLDGNATSVVVAAPPQKQFD